MAPPARSADLRSVEKVIAVHRAGWKDGSRSEEDWRATLRDYAIPKLGGRPVDRITPSPEPPGRCADG